MPSSTIPEWTPPAGSWEDEIDSITGFGNENCGKLAGIPGSEEWKKTRHPTTVVQSKCPQKHDVNDLFCAFGQEVFLLDENGTSTKATHASNLFDTLSDKMQHQRQFDSTHTQRQKDEAQYRRLLEKYADILESDNKASNNQSLITAVLSWFLVGKSISPSQIYRQGHRLLTMAGQFVNAVSKLIKTVPALSCAVLFGFVSAVGLTWCWWYMRRNCVWIIYRLLIGRPGDAGSFNDIVTTFKEFGSW
ncbi:transcription factor TAF25 [Purpureocillium lavendulum]|uniref:Transcription factor TAF25 n=1 Tax=Purpureocillium lavendulum TaxID=1247861 RepID=A0AB34FBA4_9HYPO|nr:transcription factor TAF25 [Purpureocillium lavendulum]